MNHAQMSTSALPYVDSWSDVAQGENRVESRCVVAIMILAASYQAGLCLLYTFGAPTSATLVGLSEALIMFACLPILARRLLPGVIVVALFAITWLCLASLFTGQINIKAARDLLIPLCFFWLGSNVGHPSLAERVLIAVLLLVLAAGLVELLWLDLYTRFMDIFGYYVSTGNLLPVTDYVRDSRLQLNGLRPEGIGRTLLPDLLGSHRVSSVFLEPVSLGNFATLFAAWGLSYDSAAWRKGVIFVVAAVVLMVLADSRFTLMLLPLMVAVRVLLRGSALTLSILSPLAALAILLLVGLQLQQITGDNLLGRLAISGRALLEFDARMLLGLGDQPPFGDMGYAYLLSRFGLPLTLLFWACVWLLPMPNESARRFRALLCVYIALILSVSGTSLFAFKTAALVWFLLGCSLRRPVSGALKAGHHKPAEPRWTGKRVFGASLYAS